MNAALFLLAAISALATEPAVAKGSSHPQAGSDGGGIISVEWAPRARIWHDQRLWQTQDGAILVCEEQFKTDNGYDKKCYAKGDKDEGGRWTALQTKHADGFVLKGYEYRFTGSSGYKQLIAYYGPPTVVAGPAAPAPVASAPVPNITVKIDKVIVQRKK